MLFLRSHICNVGLRSSSLATTSWVATSGFHCRTEQRRWLQQQPVNSTTPDQARQPAAASRCQSGRQQSDTAGSRGMMVSWHLLIVLASAYVTTTTPMLCSVTSGDVVEGLQAGAASWVSRKSMRLIMLQASDDRQRDTFSCTSQGRL
jgi:hypothetical protein